jgi:uridylate kinase
MDRVQGDYMGMLATVINGMALQGAWKMRELKQDFSLPSKWIK